MSKFNVSMFQSIKESLAANDNSGGGYNDILRTEIGKTYIVRLVPYVKSLPDTFFRYYTVGWESFATGQYVSAVSPSSFGERDPILENRSRIYKHGSDEEKEKIQAVKRAEKWLVNAHVIKDPTNPENEGNVKLLRYGKQLDKIIRRAIDGDDADEFSEKVFDFSPNGVNLKIDVEEQGGYPSYTSSRFVTSNSDLGLTDADIEEIYESAFNLKEVFPVKSFEELQQMWEDHYVVSSHEEGEVSSKPSTTQHTASNTSVDIDDSDDDVDPQIAELLAGLNDD